MTAYLVTTGGIFALIALAHVWRIIDEPDLASDPWFLLLTLAAGALSVWAVRLLRSAAGRGRPPAE